MRYLFLLHRYMGIAIGVVMALWCLSGFVMMYVQFPDITAQQRIANLSELQTESCCTLSERSALQAYQFDGFRLEMMADTPVLRLSGEDGSHIVNLADGRTFSRVSQDVADQVSRRYAERREIKGQVRFLGLVDVDQWTVYGSFNSHRPLYQYGANDEQATQWYVSSLTGEVVQATSARQRFWNYPGSITHWLYPTFVRKNTVAWAQTVIWLSVIGCFLTVTGLVIGIRQFRRRRNGRRSPYRGWALWHHYTGLIFGVLVLSWVVSGLFSMNPWGMLRSTGAQAESQLIRRGDFTWDDISEIVSIIPQQSLPEGVVQIEGGMFNGTPYLVTTALEPTNVDGARPETEIRFVRQRYDQNFIPATLSRQDLELAARRLQRGRPPASVTVLNSDDAYYYSHHVAREFPVVRVIAADEQATRFYLDPLTGVIRSKVDRNARWYRWLHYGLHRGDLFHWLRVRPVWDLVLWPLLLGVSIVCITGAWLGIRRLRKRKTERGNAKLSLSEN